MDKSYRKEARKQYFHYFRFWFIGIGIMAVVCSILAGMKWTRSNVPRANNEAPLERVYDYADVLTNEEEEQLRQYIAQAEKKLHIDIVIVTINMSVEGYEAMEQYGWNSADWERNMRDIADDFWDEHKYGYNKGFEGDGALLLQNWYEGQGGEHLSTSGRVERAFSSYDIDRVLDAVEAYYATDPYRAYVACIDRICELLEESSFSVEMCETAVGLAFVVALIYALAHLNQKKAENTTAVNAYVAGGKPEMRNSSDTFLRKSVSSRRIQTSSGGGGSGRSSSGGGGHHHSSSGASHGGGSRRH